MVDLEDIISEEVGGFCGIIAPIIALGAIAISILVHPGFVWMDWALSDLGRLGTPHAGIFNFGLILSGIFFFIFALSLMSTVENDIGQIGVFGFMVGIFFFVIVGFSPAGASPYHTPAAILGYTICIASLVTIGVSYFIEMEYVWAAFIWSEVIAAVSLAAIIYTIPDIGHAIPELVGSMPIVKFAIVFGARLFAE